MVSYRIRVSKKGKRWIKGQSSNSNPQCRKYRDSAKSGYFTSDNSDNSSLLTTEALKQHDELGGYDLSGTSNKNSFITGDSQCVETESTYNGTYKTRETFASDFSLCTNVSFSRLLTKFNSKSAHDKEMLAVLSGVTEAIKANGGSESTTEYFAALVTTLEGMKNKQNNEDTVSAFMSLLGMCIKGIPRAVLQVKFSSISKILFSVLKQYMDSNTIILTSTIKCLAVLLRAQEVAVWNDSSTVLIYDAILSFVIHTKPKIRKSSQQAVCAILKGSSLLKDEENFVNIHPMSKRTGKYCIEILDRCISNGEVTGTLHILNLLKEILVVFQESQLKLCCETLLKLMTLRNMLITSSSMQVLHGMFSSSVSITNCPIHLNLNLITALYDYQPRNTDTQPLLAWLAVMQEAFLNLSRNNLMCCIQNLGKFFDACMDTLLVSDMKVVNNAIFAMRTTIKECLTPAAKPEQIENYKSTIEKMFDTVCSCMDHKFYKAWRQVLFVIKAFVQACGETCYEFIMPYLKTLSELRDKEEFTYKNELDQVFCSAVQTIGPTIIIQKLPLGVIMNDEGKCEFQRSWLLPIMKDNVRKSTLESFNKYFLPIATYCRTMSVSSNHKPAAVSYDLLQCQIWALLPSFCNQATDIADTFPSMAKALGTALRVRRDITLTLLFAIRRLIKRSLENEADIKIMESFAKNYLPILFNLYTTPGDKKGELESIRSSTFDTIKDYLMIANDGLRTELFNRALAKLESAEALQTQFIRQSVFDLIKLLLPYQTCSSIHQLYQNYISKVLEKKDKEQKKDFRLLESILNSKASEGCKEFVQSHLSNIRELLFESKSKAAVITRGARIKCFTSLLDYDSSSSTMDHIIPEAIMCCIDTNVKCRQLSLLLLGKVGDMAMNTGEDVLKDYFDRIIAGLVGKTNTIRSTIVALTFLTYRYKGKLHPTLLDMVIRSICLLCSSPTREIVGPAISFIRSMISCSLNDVTRNLPLIVRSLSAVTDNCKNGFRQNLHVIYDRLVQKFGANAIITLIPSNDEKTLTRLRALRKVNNRKLKTKAKLQVEKRGKDTDRISEFSFNSKSKIKTMDEILAECDSTDDDEEDLKEAKRNPKKTKKETHVFIHEDPESIVDFMDTATTKNISMSGLKNEQDKMKLRRPSTENCGFKTASDGRLIITEEEDETPKRKNTTFKMAMDDDEIDGTEELDDNLSVMLDKLNVDRKRKRNVDDESVEVKFAPKYKAGGIGIHRNTNKKMKNKSGNKKSNQSGVEYRSSKAKGDMKKKGLPDPFAYVPLKRNSLNKRKRQKSSGEFKNIVQGAKKGAQAGSKKKFKKMQPKFF